MSTNKVAMSANVSADTMENTAKTLRRKTGVLHIKYI